MAVAEAADGGTLRLGDGRLVRLAGVEPPRRPLGQEGPWPPEEAAHEELQRLAAGKTLRLVLPSAKPDRYGRLSGDFLLGDGQRLSFALVSAGLARVRVAGGEIACFVELLAGERSARQGRRGLWRLADYAVLSALDASLGQRSGLYELVEGRVLSVGHGTRLVFLDFGRDYRRDFTVMLPTAIAGRLAVPVEALRGRRIRVRGIIEESNGPAIRVEDGAAIELLDEEGGADKAN